MTSIAARIRALRRQQKRPLRDVAGRCGFTISLLSKIESGHTSPPIATLAKIASALGVTLGELVDGGPARSTVFQAAAIRAATPPTPTEKGYGFHLLAAGRSAKAMQPFLFEARLGEVSAGALSHDGEEFVFVLEGSMRYRVGAATYVLGPGDSLYFDANEEHDLEPITTTVRYLAVLAAPPFPIPPCPPPPAKPSSLVSVPKSPPASPSSAAAPAPVSPPSAKRRVASI